MKKILVIVSIIALAIAFFIGTNKGKLPALKALPVFVAPIPVTPTPSPFATSPLGIKLQEPALSKTIQNDYHIFQTFNNCGPASLSMALSYYGINQNQEKLGIELRPYQNPQGDNDDKSVTLEEMAEKALEYNLTPYHRPNGSIELIKAFITYDIPVITRTLSKENDDIGHYRLIRGFDDTLGQFIQDDSLQGADLKYSYGEFLNLWQGFNYEYLVLVPKEKQALAESILRESNDEKKAWEKALELAQKELQENPDDIFTKFNISFDAFNGYLPVLIFPFLCGIFATNLVYGTACFPSITFSSIIFAFSVVLFLIKLHISIDVFFEIPKFFPLTIASILFH